MSQNAGYKSECDPKLFLSMIILYFPCQVSPAQYLLWPLTMDNFILQDGVTTSFPFPDNKIQEIGPILPDSLKK